MEPTENRWCYEAAAAEGLPDSRNAALTSLRRLRAVGGTQVVAAEGQVNVRSGIHEEL